MSQEGGFFGFDTSLPSSKGGKSESNVKKTIMRRRGNGRPNQKLTSASKVEDVDQILEERFKVTGGLEEEGRMNLDTFSQLEQEADVLNDETFGDFKPEDMSREFDFGGVASKGPSQTEGKESATRAKELKDAKDSLSIDDIERQLLHQNINSDGAQTIKDVEEERRQQSLPAAGKSLAEIEAEMMQSVKPLPNYSQPMPSASQPLVPSPLSAADILLMLRQGVNPLISLAAFYHNNPSLAPSREVQQQQFMVLQAQLQQLAGQHMAAPSAAPTIVPMQQTPTAAWGGAGAPRSVAKAQTKVDPADCGKSLEYKLAEFRKTHKISPPLSALRDTPNGSVDVLGNRRKERIVWMTRNEKQVIGKIQISQLLDKTAWTEDYYYHTYSKENLDPTEGDAKVGKSGQQSGQKLGKAGKWLSQRMQNQMQSIIVRHRQHQSSVNVVMLQGALGKISANNFQRPREALQLHESTPPALTDQMNTDAGDASGAAGAHSIGSALKQQAVKQNSNKLHSKQALAHHSVLCEIETIYNTLIELERAASETEANEVLQTRLKNDIWGLLHLSDIVPLDQPHVFMQILHYSKGKKLIPRLIPYLTPQQSLTFVDVLLTRLNDSDACSLSKKPSRECVDLFMNYVVPPVVTFVSTAALPVVSACLRVLMIRHSMLWVAGSKVGLAILTMLLSRAEIVKQGGHVEGDTVSPLPTDRDLQNWNSLYGQLFQTLQGHFADLFVSGQESKPAPLYRDEQGRTFTSNLEAYDDLYVWQFLAAMSVSATSIDQQRVLVTEVRQQVLQAVRNAKINPEDDSLETVNLFLNALGLDASQLS